LFFFFVFSNSECILEAGMNSKESIVRGHLRSMNYGVWELQKYCRVIHNRHKGQRTRDCCILGYNAVESQLMFWRRMVSPFSGMKSKPSNKPTWRRQQANLNMKEQVPLKHEFTLNGLCGIISQKAELFITIDIKTSYTTEVLLGTATPTWSTMRLYKGARHKSHCLNPLVDSLLLWCNEDSRKGKLNCQL
jgi:hypothetical protein